MLRIKKAEDKLRAEKQELEQLVTERTAEISKKNRELTQEIEEREKDIRTNANARVTALLRRVFGNSNL